MSNPNSNNSKPNVKEQTGKALSASPCSAGAFVGKLLRGNPSLIDVGTRLVEAQEEFEKAIGAVCSPPKPS